MRTGLSCWDKQEEILKRVKEKEYIKRCLAVDVCPLCGKDHENTERPNSNWTALACPTKKCADYGKLKRC